jgi:hypothetical protein
MRHHLELARPERFFDVVRDVMCCVALLPALSGVSLFCSSRNMAATNPVISSEFNRTSHIGNRMRGRLCFQCRLVNRESCFALQSLS